MTEDNDLLVPFDFASDIMLGDMTLYARWLPHEFTVTFIDKTNQAISEQKVRTGDKPSKLDDDAGYTFDGWHSDEDRTQKYDFSKPISSNTKIYGKWTQRFFTVAFDSNGGSKVNPQSQKVAYGKLSKKPADPVWKGHTFLGWFEDCSSSITPNDIAKEKKRVAGMLKTGDLDSEMAEELKSYQQKLDRDVIIAGGKVLVKFTPNVDAVYSDVSLKAQWSEDKATPSVKPSNKPSVKPSKTTKKVTKKYAPLKLRNGKVKKKSIKLMWNKVKGAKKYVVYGAKCTKKSTMKKVRVAKGKAVTIKKIGKKKLAKRTPYKFRIVALDRNGKAVAKSKVIHVFTAGGKYGNPKSVVVKKSIRKKALKLKKGKKLKLRAKIKMPAKKKLKKFARMRYESTNPAVAKVTAKGVVKAKKKGTCYAYAYAQNGVAKKVKIRVR